MNVKEKIIKAAKKKGVKLSVPLLSRYISGELTTPLTIGLVLSKQTGTDLEIWLDKKCKEERLDTLKVYSENTGLQFFSGPGRPRVQK